MSEKESSLEKTLLGGRRGGRVGEDYGEWEEGEKTTVSMRRVVEGGEELGNLPPTQVIGGGLLLILSNVH